MVRLTRTVRFALNPPGASARAGEGFSGRPGLSGFGALYEMDVHLVGEPGAHTGYLMDIKAIDRAVREAALAVLERARGANPASDPMSALPGVFAALARALPERLGSLTLRLSPFHAIELSEDSMTTALLRLRFDFAASHRLHTASLSAEENRRLFGKCNWESGHGHNYEFEPCVEVSLDASGTPSITPAAIERLAQQIILDRYDHRHLNLDCEEFGPGGVNPTVENIARVFYERFAPAVERAGGRLREVLVRESDRTSATYPA